MTTSGGYVAPEAGLPGFHCPVCGAFAQQAWSHVFLGAPSTPNTVQHNMELLRKRQLAAATAPNPSNWSASPPRKTGVPSDPFLLVALQDNPTQSVLISAAVNAVRMSLCGHCAGRLLWVGSRIVWPQVGGAQPANPDMPDDVREEYQEAASIVYQSPRGAAALLRLAIQKLCKHLGEPGENINADVGALVAKGLDTHIQEALDAVRVIGNESVHPGEMDLKDDRETAVALFGLINLIVEDMISRKKRINAVYSKLPASKLKGIEGRDAKTTTKLLEPPET